MRIAAPVAAFLVCAASVVAKKESSVASLESVKKQAFDGVADEGATIAAQFESPKEVLRVVGRDMMEDMAHALRYGEEPDQDNMQYYGKAFGKHMLRAKREVINRFTQRAEVTVRRLALRTAWDLRKLVRDDARRLREPKLVAVDGDLKLGVRGRSRRMRAVKEFVNSFMDKAGLKLAGSKSWKDIEKDARAACEEVATNKDEVDMFLNGLGKRMDAEFFKS